MDGSLAWGTPGTLVRGSPLGEFDPQAVACLGLRLEATPVRTRPGSRAREKKGKSAGKSANCHRVASSCSRTKRTSCSSRLCTAWGLHGQPTEVPISGFNARRAVFGTINIDTGHRLFLARQRQRGEDFRAFLAIIHSHYRGWQVALLLDEDPSHTAHGSKDLAAELGIRLIWLPKRCPELNGMDHLWFFRFKVRGLGFFTVLS